MKKIMSLGKNKWSITWRGCLNIWGIVGELGRHYKYWK